MAQSLDATYPTIARWVMEYGSIEIGQNDMSRSFVRALDEGGLVWEGQEDYATLDDALRESDKPLPYFSSTSDLIVPATYAPHQPDMTLLVLPRPRSPAPS
jgi:hypothetical protein